MERIEHGRVYLSPAPPAGPHPGYKGLLRLGPYGVTLLPDQYESLFPDMSVPAAERNAADWHIGEEEVLVPWGSIDQIEFGDTWAIDDPMRAKPEIPGAKNHGYRHDSVPGPRLLWASGIEVRHGDLARPGSLRLEAEGRPEGVPGAPEPETILVTVNGITKRIEIPRASLEAFLAATRWPT